MNIEQKSLVELTEEALTILQRELGTANTIRFVRQFSTGFGDYTAARAAQPEETLDEIVEAIQARRRKKRTAQRGKIATHAAYQQRIDRIRQAYPRAYEKWTDEEDEQLRQKHLDGAGVNELAGILQRQPRAIKSRLRRLGM
jgi:hypothetical protein